MAPTWITRLGSVRGLAGVVVVVVMMIVMKEDPLWLLGLSPALHLTYT